MGETVTEEAVLEFDHNVIEHLGIRLYQNKIINVISELVANCWDADAKHFAVDVATEGQLPFISVTDDGTGMSYDDVRTRYLVIGKKKRNSPKDKSAGGRAPMGRKVRKVGPVWHRTAGRRIDDQRWAAKLIHTSSGGSS